MSPKRTRRTAEERIADLQAEIARVKARAAQAKVKKDPALRHISGAIRSLDKALAETKDKATREALTESRATLAACLALAGAAPAETGATTTKPRRAEAPDVDTVIAYLRNNPNSRSEEICGELGTDAASLRTVLHRLRDEKKIKVKGKARAMRYSLS